MEDKGTINTIYDSSSHSFESFLDSDDSVVPTVVSILERGWSQALQDDLAKYRSGKESQMRDLSKRHFEDFAHRSAVICQLRQQSNSMKKKALHVNESIQYAGSGLVDTRKQLLDLKCTKHRLQATSEQVASSLSAIALVKLAVSQIESKSYLPALRTLRSTRSIVSQADAHLAKIHAEFNAHIKENKAFTDDSPNVPQLELYSQYIRRSKLLSFVKLLVPQLENEIQKQVKQELTEWLMKARERSVLAGRLARIHAEKIIEGTKEFAQERESNEQNKAKTRRKFSYLLQRRSFEKQENRIQRGTSINAYDFAPVFQFVHVFKFLGLYDVGMQYYKDIRVMQADLKKMTPIEVSVMDATMFSQQFVGLLENIIGFFVLEEELGTHCRLIRRVELQKLWFQVFDQLGPVVVKHLSNVSDVVWIEDPYRVLQLVEHIVATAQVFAVKRRNKQHQQYVIDNTPVIQLCKFNKQVFIDSLTNACITYVQNAYEMDCYTDSTKYINYVDTTNNKESDVMTYESICTGDWYYLVPKLAAMFKRRTKQSNARTIRVTEEEKEEIAENDENIVAGNQQMDMQDSLPFGLVVPKVTHFAVSMSQICSSFANVVGEHVRLNINQHFRSKIELKPGVQNAVFQSGLNGAAAVLYKAWECFDNDLLTIGEDLTIEQACQFSENADSMVDSCTLIATRLREVHAVNDEEDDFVQTVNPLEVIDKIKKLFESVAGKAQNQVINQVRNKLDDLCSSASMVSWTPNDPPKFDQPHDFVQDAIGYLSATFSPNSSIMNYLPRPMQEALHFIACRHISDILLWLLTGEETLEINAYALETVKNDIKALQVFAKGCTVVNLTESFDQLNQMLDLILEGELEHMLDSNIRTERYALVAMEPLLSILAKYKDITGKYFGSSASRKSKYIKRKKVDEFLQLLELRRAGNSATPPVKPPKPKLNR